MKFKKRSLIQIFTTSFVIAISFLYCLYINDYINFRILSIGDMNPYGGWSAFKSAFTDLSYRWRGFSRSIALSAAVGVTALLMGRFFCGFICPIGALQDFFKYLGTKLRLKEIKLHGFKIFKPEIIKYFILIIVLVLSILGAGNLISPFSPWLAYLNIFAGFNLQFGSIILLIIMILSLFIKRIFCRCFCPFGAFQSLLYAVGPLKINKGKNCNGCSHCLKNCPVGIENSDDIIISPECVNCLECTETACVKESNGFSINFAGRSINNKKYILISMCIFIGIYAILPLIPTYSDTQLIGSVGNIKDGLYEGNGIGFGGKMEVQVSISKNKVEDIKMIDHMETTGYFEEVFREMSKDIIETQNLNADAISGATATSRGFLNAVKDAVSKSLDIN